MIDICMLSCNRARLTDLSIRTLQERTTTEHRLIVLDNGSQDDSPKVLRQLKSEGLIDVLELSDTNRGVHWGFNRLLDAAKSAPYYVCTDNDLIPCVPLDGCDWLSRLIKLADEHPGYGAIACRPHILIGEPGDRFKDSPPVRHMSHIGAHLRIMRTGAVRAVGGWKKTEEPSRNNEDWWIGGKLKKEAGLDVGYSRDIRAIHLWGSEEENEDPWGYPLSLYEECKGHGHTERWPPVSHYSWNRQGISWTTCIKE